MASKIHTYYFGRLNLIGAIRGTKVDFILEGLTSESYVEERGFRYSFLEVETIQSGTDLLAYGLLVKYKQLLEGELVDESARRIVEGGLELGVVAKSPFFLHFSSSLITYRPVVNRISDSQFRRIFCRLLEEGHDNFFIRAEIVPITEDQGILLAIDTFQKIEWLKLDLHPTNPDNTPEFRSVDERIKELEASRLKEEIFGGESGLDKQALKNDEAYKGVIMAQHGYGEARLKGVNSNGREVTISTKDSPTTTKIVASESPTELLERLIGTLRRLASKGDHDEVQ